MILIIGEFCYQRRRNFLAVKSSHFNYKDFRIHMAFGARPMGCNRDDFIPRCMQISIDRVVNTVINTMASACMGIYNCMSESFSTKFTGSLTRYVQDTFETETSTRKKTSSDNTQHSNA
jgi:hypothetical protein